MFGSELVLVSHLFHLQLQLRQWEHLFSEKWPDRSSVSQEKCVIPHGGGLLPGEVDTDIREMFLPI